jgi:hypothetical protein
MIVVSKGYQYKFLFIEGCRVRRKSSEWAEEDAQYY